MPRRREVLQGPMEVAAGTTYAQPESEGIPVNGAKAATIWVEIYKNGSATGSATLAIQTWTETKPQPYARATGGGPVTPTGGTFTISTTSLGTLQPIQLHEPDPVLRHGLPDRRVRVCAMPWVTKLQDRRVREWIEDEAVPAIEPRPDSEKPTARGISPARLSQPVASLAGAQVDQLDVRDWLLEDETTDDEPGRGLRQLRPRAKNPKDRK